LALGVRSYDPYGVDDWLPVVDKALVDDMDDQLLLMQLASRLHIQIVVDLCFVENDETHYQAPNFFYGDGTTHRVYLRFRARHPDEVGYYSALVPPDQPLLHLSRKDMVDNALTRLIGLMKFLVVCPLSPSEVHYSIKDLFGHSREAEDLEDQFPDQDDLGYWIERHKQRVLFLKQRSQIGGDGPYSPPARRALGKKTPLLPMSPVQDNSSLGPVPVYGNDSEHPRQGYGNTLSKPGRITSGSGRVLVPINKPRNSISEIANSSTPRFDTSTPRATTFSSDQWGDNSFLSRASTTAVTRIQPSGNVPFLGDAVLTSVQKWKKSLRAYLGQYQCDVQVHYHIEPTIAKVLKFQWNEARGARFPDCPPWEVAAFGNPMTFLDWLQRLSPYMFAREFAQLPLEIKYDCPSPYSVDSNPFYVYAAKVSDVGQDRCATFGTIIKALIRGLQKNWSSLANKAERWLQEFRAEHQLTDDLMTSAHLDEAVVVIGRHSLDMFSDQRLDREASRSHVLKAAAISSSPINSQSGRSSTKNKNKFRKGKSAPKGKSPKQIEPGKSTDKPLTKDQ
jgi:hypothetical protein